MQYVGNGIADKESSNFLWWIYDYIIRLRWTGGAAVASALVVGCLA